MSPARRFRHALEDPMSPEDADETLRAVKRRCRDVGVFADDADDDRVSLKDVV